MSLIQFARACRASLFVLALSPVVHANEADSDVLTLARAIRLATTQQPLLLGQQAAITAKRQTAASAAQLPDPQLTIGLTDLSLSGDRQLSLREESDTQFRLGVQQEFPRAAKRELKERRAELEAESQTQDLDTTRRDIRRSASLAWLDVYQWEAARSIMRTVEVQARLQVDNAGIAYTAGRMGQADLLAAKVELETIHDRQAEYEQDSAHARSMLSRWIGEAAYGPIDSELPRLPAPSALDAMLEELRSHPHLSAAAKQVEVAQTDVSLARQAYRPDWRVDVGYGYRPAFADYISVQVGVDLPYFTANRQDRALAASLAELERARTQQEDSLRQHQAELRLNYLDWQRLQGRLQHYDQDILPQTHDRIEAAELAYRSGKGDLASILAARRAELDLRLQRLSLQTDQARHLVQLQYFTAHDSAAQDAIP